MCQKDDNGWCECQVTATPKTAGEVLTSCGARYNLMLILAEVLALSEGAFTTPCEDRVMIYLPYGWISVRNDGYVSYKAEGMKMSRQINMNEPLPQSVIMMVRGDWPDKGGERA